MADAHAPPTSTTDVRYPVDSERELQWDDETGTHVQELSVNRLLPGEMLALAEALRSETCTLHTLHLPYNEVGAEGARALAEALRSESCTLHTLDLHYNGVGADVERDLDEARALSRARRRPRHHGLLRAIVRLAILRQRASEVVFRPKRLRREGVFDAWAHDG